jgi:integrase
MASIANDPGGRRRILFVDKDGDRKAIWLGKVSKRLAEEIKGRVEGINAAAIAGCSIDGETAEWLARIGDPLHAKLATVGLVTPRHKTAPKEQARLGDFLESYIAGRTDVKERTRLNLDAARRRLVAFFGSDKPLDEITAGDAKDWTIDLKKDYAQATVAGMIVKAKQFFASALDRELIAKNPFAKIKPPSQANEARKFFVNLEVASKVLDACPDAEWRLLFALSRFGGLRCPSEHFALKWNDLDWERNRFRVTSPKTAHHEGKGERWVPIFPELRPYFEEAFELAAEGAIYIINRYRDVDQNLRTQLRRIIRKAGLDPWTRVWHNLRSSRETELAGRFPVHVVCAWMGHAALIAQKHYLQVTEQDFQLAADPNSAPNSALTAQNTAQHRARTERAPNEKTPQFAGFSGDSSVISAVGEYPRQDSNLQPSVQEFKERHCPELSKSV